MEKDEISLIDGTEFFESTDNIGAGDEAQRRLLPFLDAARSSDSKTMCNNLAAKCAELQADKDKLIVDNKQLGEQLRSLVQTHETEISDLKAQLDAARKKRDEFGEKCREMEKRMMEEESLYFRAHLGGPRLSEAVAQSANAQKEGGPLCDQYLKSRNTSLQQYFTTMDESQTVENATITQQSGQVEVVQQIQAARVVRTVADFGVIDVEDFMNQTQTVAANLTTYADRLFDYRSNVVTLYEQLKSTANFLVEVVRRVVDEDDEQIQLLLQKIDALQLNVEQNNTVAEQMMNESKHVADELSILGLSMRAAAETSRQQLPLNATLLAELEEARQKSEQLTAERKQLLKQCDAAIKMANDRDEELENRAKIIAELQQVLNEVPSIDRKAVTSLVKKELTRIYEVMSSVPHTVVE